MTVSGYYKFSYKVRFSKQSDEQFEYVNCYISESGRVGELTIAQIQKQ